MRTAESHSPRALFSVARPLPPRSLAAASRRDVARSLVYRDRTDDGRAPLELLVDSLEDSPPGELAGGLAELAHGLGARGAALVSVQGTNETVLAAWGEMDALAVAERQRQRARAADQSAPAAQSIGDLLVVELPPVGGESLALLVSGVDGTPEQAALARLALRLLAHGHRRERAAGSPFRLPGAPSLRFPDHVVVGKSPRMEQLHRELQAVAPGDFPVLVVGETGVGKEHLARTLHASSRRASGPFVAINCAAIPAELLESELFGIARGVATGVSERAGKFREAAGGTLLLDEIGEMSLPLQAKLLRALAERELMPLGGASTALEARIVAATNQDLAARAAAGEFRLDLYYRLAAYVVAVPPLRERGEDVPALVEHFLQRFWGEVSHGRGKQGMTWGALRSLLDYDWPGNVRELEHVVRRLVLAAPDSGVIDQAAVDAQLRRRSVAPPAQARIAAPSGSLSLEENEQALILETLRLAGGNRTHAAQRLGISRNGLQKKLRRLGVV